MRPLLRLLRRALAGLAILLLLLAAGLGCLLWFTLPRARQEAAIPGLSGPVEISFDQDGVPRIHAGSAEDAAAALGFVHARDRMFQLDLMRRAASGTLSEIAGPATLPMDRYMRTLGLRRRAAADFPGLPAPTRALLEAYSRGVNAWIAARGRLAAPEFLALGAPAPWTPIDSLLWGKTMGLWLSANYRTELSRLSLAGVLPQARIDELWPPDGQAGHPDASLDTRYAGIAAELASVLPRFPAAYTLPSTASNAWAVDGRRTITGAPLLAGDPHLQFGQPGIWYLARIETPAGVLAGATAPGVPFLVIGHNGRIAWTFTTTGADVQDVFEETAVDDGHYLGPDGPLAYITHQERIGVRGRPDVVMTVRETRHGPVVSDLGGAAPSGSERGGKVLAVAMANLQPGDTAAAGLLALNQAGSVAEAGQAAAEISTPVQNLMVADRQRIGLFMTGRIPLRRAGNGSAPVPGADGAYDWTGFASGEALPHIMAPASGRLVNANERVAPPDFSPFLGRDWFGDWRARRIRALLEAGTAFSVADFSAMQTDVVSAYAAQLLPVLRAVPPPPGLAGRAAGLLAGWDGAMTRDAPQPLIFNAWLDRFYLDVLAHNGVPESAGGPPEEFTAFVLSPAGAHWCGGDCTERLQTALSTAMAGLAERFGDDPARWRWGAAHQAVFAHPVLRNLPLLGWLTTARIEAPGDDSTIDRGGTRVGGFTSIHGASFRGAYDLADLDRSRFVVTPGQSGNPLSRHLSDFVTRWRDGDTITLGPEPRRVTATLKLTPQAEFGQER
ncbi:MAG: penicillin acylase family protein [Acidisphaera sp.]|nr:penicillin acylase family protein [Acidisphaera sp.]